MDADKIEQFKTAYASASSASQAAIAIGLKPQDGAGIARFLGLPPKEKPHFKEVSSRRPISAASLEALEALRPIAEKHGITTMTLAYRVAALLAYRKKQAERRAANGAAVVTDLPPELAGK